VYKIQYLPLALDDLKDIIRYIAHTLESPQAAENLLSKIDKEIQRTADNPFRCHLYAAPEKLKYEYRVLHIDSYSVFYEVEKDKIEIHRIIHSRRDTARVLSTVAVADIE
jgi:toxin ParE1/3/4